MTLDKNYSIERDSYNVILKYYEEGDINPATGKPAITKAEYFYPSLETALNAYTTKVLTFEKGIQNVIDELKTTRLHIASLLRESGYKLK